MKDPAVYTPLKAWYAYAPDFITIQVGFQRQVSEKHILGREK